MFLIKNHFFNSNYLSFVLDIMGLAIGKTNVLNSFNNLHYFLNIKGSLLFPNSS